MSRNRNLVYFIRKHLPDNLAIQVKRGEISIQEAWQLNYVGILDGVLDFEYQSLMCKAVKRVERITSNKTLDAAIAKHFNRYADYVCQLIESPGLRQTMGAAGIKASQHYQADRIMPQWKELFEHLLG